MLSGFTCAAGLRITQQDKAEVAWYLGSNEYLLRHINEGRAVESCSLRREPAGAMSSSKGLKTGPASEISGQVSIMS